MTALGHAIRRKHEDIAILLIKHGADPTTRLRGISLFDLAVQQQCAALVGQILGNTVAQGNLHMLSELVHSQDARGTTPLHRALSQNDISTARYLAMVDINLNAKVKTILHGAAARDDVLSFERLLNLFDTLRKPYKLDLESRTDNNLGHNALLIACEHGSTGMVRLLLQHGANALAQSTGGWYNVFHW